MQVAAAAAAVQHPPSILAAAVLSQQVSHSLRLRHSPQWALAWQSVPLTSSSAPFCRTHYDLYITQHCQVVVAPTNTPAEPYQEHRILSGRISCHAPRNLLPDGLDAALLEIPAWESWPPPPACSVVVLDASDSTPNAASLLIAVILPTARDILALFASCTSSFASWTDSSALIFGALAFFSFGL